MTCYIDFSADSDKEEIKVTPIVKKPNVSLVMKQKSLCWIEVVCVGGLKIHPVKDVGKALARVKNLLEQTESEFVALQEMYSRFEAEYARIKADNYSMRDK